MSGDSGDFRTLFENAPDGMAVIDPETGAHCEVNRQYCELYGYAEAAMLDMDIGTLTADDWEPECALRERLHQALRDGERTFEWRTQRRDGAQVPVDVGVSRVDRAGSDRLLVRVTPRPERSDRDAELEGKTRAMDEAPIGITITDPGQEDNPVVYANAEFERLTGYAEAEVLGRNCRFMQGEATDPDAVDRLREGIGAEEPVTVELRNYRKDGTPFWNRVTVAPITDGSGTVENFVGFQEDVTERKTYEQRLESQRDELDLLNQVLRHDIRNDLQLILAYAEMLDAHVDDEGEEYLTALGESAITAVELTTTARDIAETMLQTDAGREPVSLTDALEAQIDDVRSTFEDATVRVIEPVPDVSVLANDMLGSVFRNVLKNAIQHNDADAPDVTVSVTEGDDAVVVRVADDGPGVPDDRKGDIFGKGEKGLDSDGTGIGLYLVNTLVEQYGGTVWVDDGKAGGAVFCIELETYAPGTERRRDT